MLGGENSLKQDQLDPAFAFKQLRVEQQKIRFMTKKYDLHSDNYSEAKADIYFD